MLNGRPGRALFVFALPMIIGNLFQQFYTMVDSIIVGKYVGENALAAVGASYALTTVFIMIAIGGGIGASVITSQYLGAGQYEKMKTSISTALLAFLAVSVILAVFGLVCNRWILAALKTPEDIFTDALLYLNIYFMGLPFLFMYNILSSMFNALGKSRIPLYLLIFSSMLNILLDFWFVLGLGMGVDGVAIATVIAQGLSAVISFLLLLQHLKTYTSEKNILFDILLLGRMVKIAVPSIVQQSIVSVGMLFVQSVVNTFGSAVVAGYSAGMRVESLCIVPMIATGNAVSTFTAQNLGAGETERVRKGYRTSYGIVIGFGILICLVLTLFHEPIISAFLDETTSSTAFATGKAYLQFIAFFFVFIGFKACTDGVLRGAGDMGVYLAANLANLFLRVTVANVCAPIWGVQMVWYAVPMGWALNYVISFGWYLTGRWSKKKLI